MPILLLSFILTTVTLTQAPARPAFFTTPLSAAELAGKQALVDTAAGTFVIQLLPEQAPNHVGYFIQQARAGAYDGTTFHRVIKYGIIQGGDPLSKDPAKTTAYGTGGLGVLQAEPGAGKHTRGAVSAVLQPGKRDSAGAQFFVVITDQPALDGHYTVFGQVVEGIEVAQKISETPADAQGRAQERVEIRKITIRETPPPEPEPFADEPATALAGYRVVLETTNGPITIAVRPDKAPTHVRNFLRLASLGVYDGTAFHRVVRGFVIQTGSMAHRQEALTVRQQRAVGALAPEFNDTPHVKGVVSMARGDDPASASTSFFICTAVASSLDGKYTAFGQVVDGLPVVDSIEAAPVDGEAPKEPIVVVRARVERTQQP